MLSDCNQWYCSYAEHLHTFLLYDAMLPVTGRAAIQIGDGFGICGFTSISAAVDKVSSEQCTLKVIAAATLRSKPGSSWAMRSEHLLLIEKA